MLLSDTHDELTDSLTELSQNSQTINTAGECALHKHLISLLQEHEHLEYKAAEQSIGIHKGGDIMKSLSRALATQHHIRLIDTTIDSSSTQQN